MPFIRIKAHLGKRHRRAPHGALKALVVDGDGLVREAMVEMLRTLGQEARSAAGGAEALAVLEAGFRPDAVLIDLAAARDEAMPLLRTLSPGVPVLITTGRADQAVWDMVAAHAYVVLLPKPFGIDALSRLLDCLF